MSIRTMKSLTSTAKACNICCHLYKRWRRENPEFSGVIGYLGNWESDVEGSDTNSVSRRVRTFTVQRLEFLLE